MSERESRNSEDRLRALLNGLEQVSLTFGEQLELANLLKDKFNALECMRSETACSVSENEVAERLVDLDLLNFMDAGAPRDRWKKEYERIRAFLISLAPNVTLPLHEQRPSSCPHAEPFVYCDTCKVSPCPLGLNANRQHTKGETT